MSKDQTPDLKFATPIVLSPKLKGAPHDPAPCHRNLHRAALVRGDSDTAAMNDRNVMRAMINYGGSFVRALGEAAQCADEENLDRIKLTWPDYWKQYTEVAQCFIIDAAKRKEIKMRLQIHIDMNNDAFSGSRLAWQAEAARILRDAASRVNDGQFKNGFNLKDFNGNSVGMLVVIPEATP